MTQATISRWKFYLGSAASPQVLSAIEEVFNVSGVGKTNALVDVTNFDSPVGTREFIAGLADGDEFTVECNYFPAATNQAMAMTAVDNGDTRSSRLVYTGASPNKAWNQDVVCLGYSLIPSPTERNAIQFTFKITGEVTRT
jgi:hypothetical protein